MTHGSLFTGIGGFDLGFERARMETTWQVEQDVKAQETLAAHFPNVERHSDVRECKGLKPVDVISGGFPCQDLSVAGRRAGLTGERSGLWFEFHRILSELKPRWCVIENVPGLLSSNEGRDFTVILRGLVELGYGVCWRILDAQYFGVAQRRRRVFIVGSLGDFSCCQVLFESEGLSGNPAKSRKAGKEVAYTVRANPSHSGDKGDGGVNTTLIAHTLRSRECKPGGSMPGRGGEDDFNIVAGTVSGAEVHNGNSNPIAENYVVNCLDGAPYADRAAEETRLVVGSLHDGFPGRDASDAADHKLVSHALTVPTSNARYDPNGEDYVVMSIDENQRGELRTSEVASQLTVGGGKPGQGYPCVAFTHSRYSNKPAWITGDRTDSVCAQHHPSSHQGIGLIGDTGVRRLTPTECERLQGFPDDWTAMHKDTTRYRQLGNAVAVSVGEWIGKRIQEAG